MKERISSFLSGAVRIEFVGENRERFVNLCRNSGIYIWDIRNEKNYSLCISIEDFFLLKEILKKTGGKAMILEKYGLPFLLHRYRRRKMFLAGIVTAFCLIYVLSLFIWDIQVEGNYSYSEEEILKFLQEQQITTGMEIQKLDCDAIEKSIRNHYFDITWTSVEVAGTRLIIHIKENEEILSETEELASEMTEYGSHIVAAKDAIVTEVVIRSGTPAVKAQSEVHAGDILVYGSYDVVNDDGEVIRTQYLNADAEIYGQVVYDYDYELPLRYQLKVYEKKQKKSYALRVGGQILKLPESKTKGQTDKFSEETQASLCGNFYLPVYVIKNTEKFYTEKEYVYTQEQAEAVCEENLSYFLQNLEKNTIQIVQKDVTIEINGETCHCSGTITAIENIGQPVPAVYEEIIGETTTDYE